LPGSSEPGRVRGDDADPLAIPVLDGRPLDQPVGVGLEANLERAVRGLVAGAVEDDDAARAAERDEAREPVDELAPLAEAPRVQQVVAVEEVEGRLSDRPPPPPGGVASPPRRARSRLPR